MPDISKVNGVEVGNISKVDNVEKDNIDTLYTGEFPIAQADPANIDMTSGDNDHPFGANIQSFGAVACTAVVSGTTYVAVCGSDNANSRYPTVRVGTWNGSAVTWGDKVTIHTDGETMGHGLVWDEDNERFIGTIFDYGTNASNNYNDITTFGASLTTSGSGSPKIANINLSNMYRPYDDNNGTNYNQYANSGNAIIYDTAQNRAVVTWEKGGPSTGSSKGGDPDDVVGAVLSFTDISSNNAITTSDFTVIQDDPSNARTYFAYDSNVNRIVYVAQGTSTGDFKIKAGTITGSGSTLTVNSATSYSKPSIMNSVIGNSDSSISLVANRVSYNNNPVVFDTRNNVTHVMTWDDDVDDWVLTNFTTGSDNSITWATANGEPLRSNGLVAQYAGDITQGRTSGWTTSSGDGQPYFTTTIGFDNQYKRLVVTGCDSDNKSDVKQQGAVVAYSPTTGYHFVGTLIQMLTNAQGGGGWKTSSVGDKIGYNNVFNGGSMFYHYRQNNTTGYGATLYGITAGAGQRTASAGIFSAGNATLSTARTRCNGFGTSRIACIVVAGSGTGGSALDTAEEYNGSAVIAAGDTLSATKNQPGSCGTLTAGFVQGGNGYLTSDEYDGTNFTSGGTASTVGGDGSRAAGTQTDALVAGGYVSSYRDDTESYNGSSFTSEADTPGNVNYGGMAGTGHEDAYYFGGYPGSVSAYTYKYNGTSWSTLNSMSNGRYSYQGGGTGTDFLLTGGSRTESNDGEIWNGTSWAACATNGLSSHDLYSGSPDTDCGGTSTLAMFGGGTGSSTGSGQNKIVHHDW